MTSEVALLNKSCIALAADSASTVTFWENSQPKVRYFKGANKIFNLSSAHPVGLMTYASADLQGVPWEIIVKAYRQHLKQKAHDALLGYAEDFFDFIATNGHLFPAATEEQQFKRLADQTATKIVHLIRRDQALKTAVDDSERRKLFETVLAKRAAQIGDASFVPGADQNDANSATARFARNIQRMLEIDAWYDDVPRHSMSELAKAAILGVYKKDFTGLQETGLAFSGFGDKEYLPRMAVYRCSGFVLGKFLYLKEKEIRIDHENVSDLVPLAISEMIGTFVWGIGEQGLGLIADSFRKQADALIRDIRAAGHLPTALDVAPFIEAASIDQLDELLDHLEESHRTPLKRVISNLPFSEMAELAESLVFMESMKERVTTFTESVGGPIDVALISKSDGFIWIKRKHYFDPKLNPRFFDRHDKT